ncbi:hypothetical protein [Ochrobactrum sp. MYb379]|uniref:hypothetical protein n=1 Tax=Ochrobactrum sp. MYb379 TaxID=2745275 RepID=UPI00309765F8
MKIFISERTTMAFRELRELLEGEGARYIILGRNAEAPRASYLIRTPMCNLGIISSEFGGSQPIAAQLTGEKLLVCYDALYSVLSTSEIESISRDLEGVFYQLLDSFVEDGYIIVHEIGLKKIDLEGQEAWSISTEIIESVDVNRDGRIIVKLNENTRTIEIDARTGEGVSRTD